MRKETAGSADPADLQKFSPVIADDVYPILSLQSCLEKRAAKGGVSPQQVAGYQRGEGSFKLIQISALPDPAKPSDAGFYKKRTQGPQKFTLALVVRVEKQCDGSVIFTGRPSLWAYY